MAGFFFPRGTSTRTRVGRRVLLLSPAFPDEFQRREGTGGGRRIMLFSSRVAACTSLCRQFAKIELSARQSDLSLRGLCRRRVCYLCLRDEKS